MPYITNVTPVAPGMDSNPGGVRFAEGVYKVSTKGMKIPKIETSGILPRFPQKTDQRIDRIEHMCRVMKQNPQYALSNPNAYYFGYKHWNNAQNTKAWSYVSPSQTGTGNSTSINEIIQDFFGGGGGIHTVDQWAKQHWFPDEVAAEVTVRDLTAWAYDPKGAVPTYHMELVQTLEDLFNSTEKK